MFLAAALPLALGAGGALAQSTDPVKIGLVVVKTGPLATCGFQMEQGVMEYLKEHNQMMGGRKVKLVVADSGGTPAGAKTKVQEVVERDNVDAIIGPLAAFEALAVADYLREKQIPTASVAAAEDMTQRKAMPWFVRTSVSAAQASHPFGEWAAKEKGYKRVAMLADDIAYGHEMVAGFQRTFEEAGGKVVKKMWPPLNATDYSPYIAQIRDVDVVYVGFAGTNGLRFLRQYAEYGLKDKIPVLGGMTAIDDQLLKNMGDEAVGVISASFYSTELPYPANKKLVAEMEKDYQNTPGYCSVAAYLGAQAIGGGLDKTGGRTDDKAKLIAAVRSLNLTDTPRGPFHFDDLGNAVGNIYIREVQRKDGKLVNAVLKTFENVGQFWKWSKEDYLANPVYSRDWPPAKYLEQ
jgi:branched-chain amino acid transport system substrate-binding protein